MRLDRTKNTVRNAWYGMAYRILSIIMPFAVRTVFIRTLGVEYLGLNSLFSSILTVLSLTELGFSSAIVFCMYKPIAEDNTEEINAILAFYKKVYFYIGLIILGIGCLIIPFLPLLINGSYPADVSLPLAYVIYLVNTALSYFMFAYLSALITAFQRDDVISKINIVVTTAMYSAQIVMLISVRNYYAYLLVMPFFTIINNIRTAVVARKMFPQYKPYGVLSESIKHEIKEKVSGLVIFKLSYVSRNAFDSIFVSMFLGLTDTAIYNNYYYIMNAVVGITTVLTSSALSGAGNSVAMESEQKNYDDMNLMNFIYMWISGWFTACMAALYQPFMQIWVGKKLMYPYACVILFCIYFYVLKMGDVRYIYEQAKGLWWEYKYRSIAEAVSNLVLNYVLGKLFGVYGIILATIITIVFINYIYGAKVIFKSYFTSENIMQYFKSGAYYAITAFLACVVTYFCTRHIPYTILGFIFRAIICVILPNVILFLLLFKSKEYATAKNWISIRIKRNK
jgi:O-antigen/teichoic acid export membrane protein